MYFVGIDAGGTGCRCRIIKDGSDRVGEGQAGPATLRLGADVSLAAIKAACLSALEGLDLGWDTLGGSHIGIGVAGIERLGAERPYDVGDFGCATLTILNDGATATLGAHGGADGATVSIGTGSIAVMKYGNSWSRLGGHGFPVSDEGSGAHIGQMALSRMLDWKDGYMGGSPLLEHLFQMFDSDLARCHEWLIHATATEFASLAPVVVEQDKDGDPVAADILDTAADAAVRMIDQLEQMGAPRISLLGGLGPILEPRINRRTNVTLSPPIGDAVDGALIAARSRSGMGGD